MEQANTKQLFKSIKSWLPDFYQQKQLPMVALYELMELLPNSYVTNFSGKHQELFIYLKNQDSKLSEESAALGFLETDKQRKYFNKLKNKLKQELANQIISNPLLIDKSYRSTYEDCYTRFSIYKILLMNGKRGAAMEMAKSLIPKLKRNELSSLLHLVATDLSLYYSSINIVPALAKKYAKMVEEQLELINAKSIVKAHYNKVLMIKNRRESYTSAMIDVFKEACKKTIPYLNLKSNDINRFIYNIIITRYTAEYNYEKVINYCDEAYQSFPPDHPNYKALFFGFTQMKLLPLVALGKQEEVKRLAKESCQIASPGGFNWHLAFNRRCLICFHLEHYQEAYELYKEQAKQECPFPILWEYWRIIWGYLYFLIKVKKITTYSEERFHLGKLLNEVPNYSKDKAGNNLNLLIIQIIIRIEREQYGQIIDRMEALETYTRTYTKKRETLRANIFINMLIKMVAASFHRTATERKTQKLFEKLKRTPLRLGQSLAVEIIPYEILWREILGLLENKIYRIYKKKTAKENS